MNYCDTEEDREERWEYMSMIAAEIGGKVRRSDDPRDGCEIIHPDNPEVLEKNKFIQKEGLLVKPITSGSIIY